MLSARDGYWTRCEIRRQESSQLVPCLRVDDVMCDLNHWFADYDISLEQYTHYRRHGPGAVPDGSERSSQASTFEDDAGEMYRDVDGRQGVYRSHSSDRVPSSLTKLNPRTLAAKKRGSSADHRSDRRSRSPMSRSSRASRSWMRCDAHSDEDEDVEKMVLLLVVMAMTNDGDRDDRGADVAVCA